MVAKNILLVSVLCVANVAMATSDADGIAASIIESGTAIDNYINLAQKSEADKGKYCAYLKSAVPLHNKSLGRFVEECGSAGAKLKVSQAELAKQRREIKESTAIVAKNMPTADLTDANIKESIQQGMNSARERVMVILDKMSDLNPKLASQQVVVEENERAVSSEISHCSRGGFRKFFMQSACLASGKVVSAKEKLTTEANKLKALGSQQAQLQKDLAIAISASTQDKVAAEVEMKKSRNAARAIVAGELAKIAAAQVKAGAQQKVVKSLQEKLADLNADQGLCSKSGARTLPGICK